MTSVLALMEADWAWVVINIALPILLPVLGLWLMRVSLKKPADRIGRQQALATRRYVLLFKDGQLGWVALLMCFTAMSEFSDGLFKFHKPAPDWTIVFFLIIAGVVFAAGVFATNGAVDTIEVAETQSLLGWIAYYGVAFWTTILTLVAAAALTVAHFWATPY